LSPYLLLLFTFFFLDNSKVKYLHEECGVAGIIVVW
jgi:hypothetical protein